MPEVPQQLVAIGVDCATNPRNVGLARVVAAAGTVRVDELTTAPSWDAITAKVRSWLAHRTVIALDAPLGWPRALGEVLHAHKAGERLSAEPHAMFRRRTDDVIAREVGKRSLDVGADRIARTAHAALTFLDRLRAETGLPVPLAWEPGRVDGVVAIEVYPAATLAGRQLRNRGYKGAKGEAPGIRREIAEALTELTFSEMDGGAMVASDHVLDAVLCSLAALDFAGGDVIRPADRALAEREGWIWVRRA